MATTDYPQNSKKKQKRTYTFCPNPLCKRRVKHLHEDGFCLNCIKRPSKKLPGNLRKCKHCKKSFIIQGVNQAYCSQDCAGAYRQAGYFLLFERDDFRCIYCGLSSIEDKVKLQLDHIMPYSKNGPTNAGNLITACKSCNGHKHNKILGENIVKRLQQIVKERNRKNDIPNTKRIKMSSGYIR